MQYKVELNFRGANGKDGEIIIAGSDMSVEKITSLQRPEDGVKGPKAVLTLLRVDGFPNQIIVQGTIDTLMFEQIIDL